MNFTKTPVFIFTLSLLLGVLPQVYIETFDGPVHFWRLPASNQDNKQTAYEVFGQMLETTQTFNAKATLAVGTDGRFVTWGAEKEGSSSYISQIFGPDATEFQRYNPTDNESSEKFLRVFFSRWMSDDLSESTRVWRDDNGILHDTAVEVLNHRGRNYAIDTAFLEGFNPKEASHEELKAKWFLWINETKGRPFSFLSPKSRRELIKGSFPFVAERNSYNFYVNAKPNFGKGTKYLDELIREGNGWEVLFKPQNSYGEFQEMIAWFKESMGRNGELFQAPGHQRMVVPITDDFDPNRAAELTKAAQALTVLEGISGKSGIENASFKDVIDDWDFVEGLGGEGETDRGPIRVDDANRFVEDSVSIEFRSGTKNPRIARFIQSAMASRFSTGEFDDLVVARSWTLVDESYTVFNSDVSDFKRRFDLTEEQAQKVRKNLMKGSLEKYDVVLWNWYDDCPYFGKTKKQLLKNLTKDYLLDVASLDGLESEEAKKAIISLQREWVKASNIIEDIKKYMMPKKEVSNFESLHKFKLKANSVVDINKIDLGIEYSARFPLRFQGDYSKSVNEYGEARYERLADGKMSWLQTRVDMSPEEKEVYLEKLATDLRDRLGGEGAAERIYEDGHGHGLDIAFKIRDSKNRSWQVEWDGIGRNYTPSGDVIIDSVRAGSIEVVTPKFEPEMDEVQAVYDTFEKNNALPYIKAGGGHINIDLSVFDGKPHEFARFLAIFHEYRSVIAFMFQDLNRVKSAEPVSISEDFAKELADWQGSELELKKALYNEGYFNKRVGRKARYSHLDVSAYFQEVIPEEFISDDFDISNPQVPWRPAFRVNPNIRKAEARLMNAPRDAYESALQIKLFRAILNKALNRDDEISGVLQNMSHEDYLNDSKKLIKDFKAMMKDLSLNQKEYRPIIGESLSNVDLYTKQRFYRPLSKQLELNPVFDGWKNAVGPRSSEDAITSEGRAYLGEIYPEAIEFQQARVSSAQMSELNREAFHASDLSFNRKTSCVEAIRKLIGN